MSSLNKVILIGSLGKDPDVRYSKDGKAIVNFSIATAEKWKDKSGEKQEKVEWHNISAFGKLAEIMDKYLRKGSKVYVEGKLQTNKWTDKEGNDRYSTNIIADNMIMLGEKQATSEREEKPVAKEAPKGAFDDLKDDLPFRDFLGEVYWRVV